MLEAKIKELQALCERMHADLRIQYYGDHEVCFKAMNDNEQEIFNAAVFYPHRKDKRQFYLELNSEYEQWTGGQFQKETIMLLLSIDDLSDEELHIKAQITESGGEPR